MSDSIDEAKFLVRMEEERSQVKILENLKKTVAESNITKVANKIGIPRCTLSLVVNDKYPANPKKILQKFEAAYGGVECPYLQIDLTREQCRSYASKARPSNPLGLAHWKACQNCIHRTDKTGA